MSKATTKVNDASDAQALRRAAYTEANTRLREAHRDDFEKFYEEECKKVGVTYKRRLTDAEKAQQKIDQLLAEHPELRERYETQPALPEPADA